MNTLESYIKNYIEYCTAQKRLDTKTLKAYKIDLRQFSEQISTTEIESITTSVLETYITNLHQQYSPKTVKRKIASIKAFFHYLEYKDIIILNPFNKLQIKFREPVILPKTIPLKTLEVLFNAAYAKYHKTTSPCQKRKTLRDIAVFELLFATGIRISELCSILLQNMDLQNNIILIHGKGSKERLIHICDPNVLSILNQYYTEYYSQISACGYFFVNNNGNRLSDQSVRDMINKYCRIADIDYHITPHSVLKCSQFPSCVDFTGFNCIQNCVYCYYLSFFSKIALKHRPHYFHI